MRRTGTKNKRLGSPGSFSLIARGAENAVARGIPFERIKNAILGRKYELSVAFVSAQAVRRLNRKYRKRDRSTDILSFSIASDMGELILSSADVKKRAPEFGMSARGYLAYLVIHGCVHLKGLDHGRAMDREEMRRCKQFGIAHPSENA